MLFWSFVSIIVAIIWLSTAVYMSAGGTVYDPSDWFATINTAAGSRIAQIPGTCTGAGLEGKEVEGMMLWYGNVGGGHIAFSERKTERLEG